MNAKDLLLMQSVETFDHGVDEGIRQERERTEKTHDAMHRILDWIDAYPIEVFPEPNWENVRNTLDAAGISLASVNGSSMRHVLQGVKKIIEEVFPTEGKEDNHG